jgi:hypothetical protein
LQFTKSEVDVSHILVKDKALIDKIKAQLDKGGDFAALATKHSLDPGSKAKGGRLGKISKGRTVPQFERAAFTTAKGKYSAPVQSQFGWHIVLVHDKITEQKQLEEVAEEVKQGLSKEIITAYFEEIKSGATIVETGATEAAGEADSKAKKGGKKKSKGKLKLRKGKAGKGKAAKIRIGKGKAGKGKAKKAKSKK